MEKKPGDIADIEASELYSVSRPATVTWKNIEVYEAKSKLGVKSLKHLFLSKSPAPSQLVCQPLHEASIDMKPPNKKLIIKNVSGIARPGELMAILGPSGAGKTTLLNALNFRNKGTFFVQGEIRVNGNLIRTSEMIASISGYVQQSDIFVSSLTVKEHLVFQAMLRMDRSCTKYERLKRVEQALFDLNLKKCEGTKIGNPERGHKGISGGERRRLAFASEMITNPSILFCDEPTTGLDSYMAMTLVDCMKNLTKHGKTIICTIHQPSSEIFQMFNSLCILSEGRLAYLGNQANAFDFYTLAGYSCPAKYNPADHYIKTLSITPSDKENCLNRVNQICNCFESSSYNAELKQEIEKFNDDSGDYDASLFDNVGQLLEYKTSQFTQIRWLAWREIISLIRDPLSLRILIFQSIILGFIYGLIYFQLQLDQYGIQNINALIFLCCTYICVNHLFSVVATFPVELQLFRREHQNRMYSVLSYYIAKSITEFPSHSVLPFLFISIIYLMANLDNSISKFFTCGGIVVLAAQSSLAFGHFLSAVSPSATIATGIAGPFLGSVMIFSGHFLNSKSIPVYFLWLKYISWLAYANEALIVNQWTGVTEIKCEAFTPRCLATGENVMEYFVSDRSDFSFLIGVQFLIIFGWRTMAYLSLLIKSYNV